MVRKTLYILVCIFLVGGATFLYLSHVYVPQIISARTSEFAHNIGFAHFQVGALKNGSHSFDMQDITLDADGFSTIETMRFNYDLRKLLNDNQIKNISIINANLTGEVGETLHLSGWNLDQIDDVSAPFSRLKTISIENMVLDLWAGDIGGIQLKIDGEITPEKDESFTFRGQVQTAQPQLKLYGDLNAHLSPGGLWQAHLDFQNAAFDYAGHKASRILGKASAEALIQETAIIDANAQTGYLVFSGLNWQNAALSFRYDGTTTGIIISGKTSGGSGVEFSYNYEQGQNQTISKYMFFSPQMQDFEDYMKQQSVELMSDNRAKGVPESLESFYLTIVQLHDHNRIQYTIKSTANNFSASGDMDFEGAFDVKDMVAQIMNRFYQGQ